MSRKFEYDAGVDVPGTQYRVVRPLGAGGMGAVYEVEDLTVGRRFVMKTLHPDLRDRGDFVRRMQKEARILARLNHPNIVQVFTAGITADALRVPYYIMERLEGQNLRMLIDAKGALPLHACYTIGIELLDALDRAHELGVIHRDVKPENVFIHRNGDGTATTKLLDFGIMSLLEGEGGETGRRFIGTLRYASPEQARGEKVAPSTDIYAAGLVLYEMVAGCGPFSDANEPGELLEAHLRRAPTPLATIAACPPELNAAVMSALAKLPTERPSDAFAFAAVLRKLKKESKHVVEIEAPPTTTTSDAVSFALSPSSPSPVPPPMQPLFQSAPRAPRTPSPIPFDTIAEGPPKMTGAIPVASPDRARRTPPPRAPTPVPAAILASERAITQRRAVAAMLAGLFLLASLSAVVFAVVHWVPLPAWVHREAAAPPAEAAAAASSSSPASPSGVEATPSAAPSSTPAPPSAAASAPPPASSARPASKPPRVRTVAAPAPAPTPPAPKRTRPSSGI